MKSGAGRAAFRLFSGCPWLIAFSLAGSEFALPAVLILLSGLSGTKFLPCDTCPLTVVAVFIKLN
jgi:hypothetical protein